MTWLANVNGYYLIAGYALVSLIAYSLCVMAGRDEVER